MRTFFASRREVVATAAGLAVALSLGGSLQAPTGCSLMFIDGYLVADNGRVVLHGFEMTGLPSGPVPLDWPDGWTVRSTDDGQLEVVDPSAGGYKDAGKGSSRGTVRARTGAGIVLMGVVDPVIASPWIRDGELVVCPGEWPTNYMADYVPPDGDAP